jgi:hypothetical protein
MGMLDIPSWSFGRFTATHQLLIISRSAHPVYYDHRGDNGTHAVFLLNSDGMLKLTLHDGVRQVFHVGKSL